MDKLKIYDLSVGDWVSDKSGNCAKILGIENWPDGYMLNFWRSGAIVGIMPLASAHPILITPEILEKNGISKTYESDEYAGYKGEGFNVTEYYTELWEFEKHRNRMKIRNVHQLQHALRFAGFEKEIEL